MEIHLCLRCMKQLDQEGSCPWCGFDAAAYMPREHHLAPGTILNGKYMLGIVLGEGGFGITYVACDLNLELKVAIKEYYPNGYVTRQSRKTGEVKLSPRIDESFYQKGKSRFLDEARRMAKFQGLRGIVGVKDFFEENNTAYIVMEFAEGETLKEVLKRYPQERMEASIVFAMMEPVMDSLEEVHKARLIHRDISPDNLIVDDRGQIKLLDFGSARDYQADEHKSLSVMLKPGYTPEEQYRSHGKQGPWTDIYSLCATIYRAITGTVPMEALERQTQDTLQKPSEFGITITPGQEAALMKGLSVSGPDRFQSVSELKALLKQSEKQEEPPSPEINKGNGGIPGGFIGVQNGEEEQWNENSGTHSDLPVPGKVVGTTEEISHEDPSFSPEQNTLAKSMLLIAAAIIIIAFLYFAG